MKNKKIKILVTTGIYPPEIGGPATYTALLEMEMPKHNIDISVLPFRVVNFWPKVIRHFIFFIKTLVLGAKVDLLYTQDPVSVGFPTMLAAKVLGKPFLARIAGDWAWEQSVQRFSVKETVDDFQNKKYGWRVELLRLIQKTTVEASDLVITPSKYFRNLVARWNPSVDNVVTVYNGVNFSDLTNISNDSVAFESKTIISAGRLVPWKGFDFLIELMKNLPDWRLFIAGDGPDKERIEKIIQEKGVSDRVFVLGSINRLELFDKIRKCELFILNTSFESFSFQIVEAMFAGTPVISTNIGNISEIVESGKEGLLVPPNDKQEMLLAIRKFSDVNFRQGVVSNAKRKAENFSIQKTIEETNKVIRTLIEKQDESLFKRNIILRYLVAGTTGALTQIGSLYLLTEVAGLWYLYSSLLAFVISIAISFTLQKFWTFANKEVKKVHHQFAKYMGVAILGIITNTFFMFVFVDIFGLWYILAQFIVSLLIAVINFLAYKFFVFSK